MERVIRSCWKNLNDDSSQEKKFVFGVLLGGYASYRMLHKIISWSKKCESRRKIKIKGEESRMSKDKLREFLQEKEISAEMAERIVSLPYKELQEQLQSGRLKAVDVLNAYQYKALEVDKETNCIAEVIWEAEEIALSRDLKTGKKGPLHGIPVSLKESHMLPGYDCTGGLGFYLEKPSTEENVLVQVLKQAGAVPFVRTNIPQGMMTFECSNPIFGVTVNPHDPTRIPGGSSGGEGALIAGRGSLLGIGSDIGGSLRIPAHMSGCCALKPTTGRLSIKGEHDFLSGQTLIQTTLGPMASNVDGLVSCMKCLLVPQMYEMDPAIAPVPFKDEMFNEKRKLTVGYFVHDGNLKVMPACERAVLEVKAMLKIQGHTLVPFKPVDIYRMAELFMQTMFADGGKSFVGILEEDKVDPTLWSSYLVLRLPTWLRKFGSLVAKFVLKDRMLSIYARSFVGLNGVLEYWDLAQKIQAYRKEFLKKWKDNKLDALISPGFAYPAIPKGRAEDCMTGVNYTTLYNVINYPAGLLPVTKVTQQDVDNMKDYPSKTYTEKNIKKCCQDSVGLPVGVQFAALPYQEERVLRLMLEVETLLNPGQS